MKLAAFVGKCVLYFAAVVLIVSLVLFSIGGYLVSWPILRVTPQGRRAQAITQLFTAMLTVGRAFQSTRSNEQDAA